MSEPKNVPMTLDYAPRTDYLINVNWNYVVIGSAAMTVITWIGYGWATLLPGDYATVENGMITSTAGWFAGGLLLLLTLASFILRVLKPGWYRLGAVALLTASQQMGCYMTDDLFVRF